MLFLLFTIRWKLFFSITSLVNSIVWISRTLLPFQIYIVLEEFLYHSTILIETFGNVSFVHTCMYMNCIILCVTQYIFLIVLASKHESDHEEGKNNKGSWQLFGNKVLETCFGDIVNISSIKLKMHKIERNMLVLMVKLVSLKNMRIKNLKPKVSVRIKLMW